MTHTQLVVNMGTYDNNLKNKYELIQKIWGWGLNMFSNSKTKLNTSKKFVQAVDLSIAKYTVEDGFSDDYVSVYSLFTDNLNLQFDESDNLFKITLPKGFQMTSEYTSIPNMQYKSGDVLKKYKNFLQKVYPELDIYIHSLNEYVEPKGTGLLRHLVNNYLTVETTWIKNINVECTVKEVFHTTEFLEKTILELINKIHDVKNIENNIGSVKAEYFKCDCESCNSGDLTRFDMEIYGSNDGEQPIENLFYKSV